MLSKSLFPLIIFLCSLIFPQSFIFAQTPTSSTSATPTKESKLEDIQKIRQAVQQKVQEKIKEITSPANVKKAYIGKVIEVGVDSFTIDYQNGTRQLLVDTDTVYIDSKRNKSSFDKVKIGQDILAMGYTDENNSLLTKRLVFIDLKTISEKKNIIIVATLVDVSKSSPIVVAVPFANKDTQYQLKIDTKTEIVSKDGLKIKSDSLSAGHKVIAIFPISPSSNSKTYSLTKLIDFDYASPSPTPKNQTTP